MELEGSIETFPLSELLQMIIYSSVTGALEVQVDGETARIFSRDGRLYHAEYQSLTGYEALCRIYEPTKATFRFIAGSQHQAETLWHDPYDLMAQAERHANTWRRVRSEIPDLQCIPVVVDPGRTAGQSLSDTAAIVIRLIDGRTSILNLAKQLGQIEIEIAEAVAELVRCGAVRIRR